MRGRACFLGALVPSWLFACSDPVVDDARDALGPEQPGVPTGPLHRPGQPCVLCHSKSGPGELVMRFGGTVYKYPAVAEPLAGAIVEFTDSDARTYTAATNCAGNFFVQPRDFDPSYPVWVKLLFGGIEVEMSSPIFREGSCAGCHAPETSPSSPGQVYFAPDPTIAFPPDGCP